eukprot:scaffold129879_cov63-Phaeocystis_antarctica.AAC.1
MSPPRASSPLAVPPPAPQAPAPKRCHRFRCAWAQPLPIQVPAHRPSRRRQIRLVSGTDRQPLAQQVQLLAQQVRWPPHRAWDCSYACRHRSHMGGPSSRGRSTPLRANVAAARRHTTEPQRARTPKGRASLQRLQYLQSLLLSPPNY